MYILFFILWILLNGQFTWKIAGFGIVIAGYLYAFVCKFLEYSEEKDKLLFARLCLAHEEAVS